MQIVNGYVCFNCTDEANAKKYVDPTRPTAGPAGVAALSKTDDKDSAKGVQRPDAVVFGGTLSGLNATDNRGASKPPASARAVDISA
jgi:hypothetical protein